MLILPLFHNLNEWLGHHAEAAQLHGDDAYLAQATDHADLELRQRELARPLPWIPAYF
jgi:hypothetical protein